MLCFIEKCKEMNFVWSNLRSGWSGSCWKLLSMLNTKPSCSSIHGFTAYISLECHKNLFQCSVLLGIAVICHAQMQSFCSISSQWCDPGLLSSIRLRLFHAILVWNQIIPSVYFLLEIELTLCAHSVLKTVYNQIVHLTTQIINLVLFLASVTTVLTVFVFLVLLFYNYFEWRI